MLPTPCLIKTGGGPLYIQSRTAANPRKLNPPAVSSSHPFYLHSKAGSLAGGSQTPFHLTLPDQVDVGFLHDLQPGQQGLQVILTGNIVIQGLEARLNKHVSHQVHMAVAQGQ